MDEEAAPVVTQIYSLCLAGNGPTKIARMLTEQQIPTPGTLEYRRTGSTRRYHPGYECKWATNTVVHILENAEYTGCTGKLQDRESRPTRSNTAWKIPEKSRSFSRTTMSLSLTCQHGNVCRSYASSASVPTAMMKWVVLRHTVLCRLRQRPVSAAIPDDNAQAGLLYLRQLQETHPRLHAHFIRTDLLTAGVLSNLRKVTSYAAKHESPFMKLLIEQNEDGGKRRNAAKQKELEAAEKRIAELSAIFKRLYEDSVTGRISDERFTELSADYEAEQKELKDRAAELQAEACQRHRKPPSTRKSL